MMTSCNAQIVYIVALVNDHMAGWKIPIFNNKAIQIFIHGDHFDRCHVDEKSASSSPVS